MSTRKNRTDASRVAEDEDEMTTHAECRSVIHILKDFRKSELSFKDST